MFICYLQHCLLSAIRIVECYYPTTLGLPSDLECMETHWLVGLGWNLELGHGLGRIAILSETENGAKKI